jgi:hypothetical protein
MELSCERYGRATHGVIEQCIVKNWRGEAEQLVVALDRGTIGAILISGQRLVVLAEDI